MNNFLLIYTRIQSADERNQLDLKPSSIHTPAADNTGEVTPQSLVPGTNGRNTNRITNPNGGGSGGAAVADGEESVYEVYGQLKQNTSNL